MRLGEKKLPEERAGGSLKQFAGEHGNSKIPGGGHGGDNVSDLFITGCHQHRVSGSGNTWPARNTWRRRASSLSVHGPRRLCSPGGGASVVRLLQRKRGCLCLAIVVALAGLGA